jgi:CRISPR-associated protein Csb1
VSLSFKELMTAVQGSAAAFRSITKLQPVGGEGDKVFPATYAGGRYATEKRRILDAARQEDAAGQEREVDCVLLDSVQSQSNRAEEALKLAIERQEIELPLIEVDFKAANDSLRSPIANLTSLDVPHRLADAILRDSELADGTRFSKSEYAKKWGRSNLWNATAIYELCPTALVFGMWGSPEKPGGLGAKFERAFVSEIVAVDVEQVEKRYGFRIDPLGSSKNVLLKQKDNGSFEVGVGNLKPSQLNHGNVVYPKKGTTLLGGIRFRYAEQTTVVSLGALRKLHFPIDREDGSNVDHAGRAVLAAIGLCAGVLASESGTSLRSRCHLWPVEEHQWELLEKPGQLPQSFGLKGKEAAQLLKDAVDHAKGAGLQWLEEKVVLKPSIDLVELVRQSQELAAKEKGEGGAE